MSEMFQARRSSTYQKKLGNEDGIDMLSNLPDSILCHIISKLETIEAVKTTKLSTRVLIFLKSKSIDEFCLTVKESCNGHDIPTWVSAAIYKNVKVLKLHIIERDYIDFSMPLGLYTSNTLEVLEISNKECTLLHLDVPKFVSLPKLTTLRLNFVNYSFYSSDESVRRLISGCPSLEKLSIKRDDRDEVTTFTIDSPTLKKLYYYFDYYSPSDEEESDEEAFEFELEAPALKVEAPALEFAKLHLHVNSSKRDGTDPHYEKVVQLIQGLLDVNHLWISGDTLEALSHGPSHKKDLWKSMLRMVTNYSEQSLLQELYDPSTKSHDFYLSKDSSDTSHVVRWSAPPELPVCLLSCLKTISVSGFIGRENELSTIAYILKYAKVLKNITITEAEAASNFELREKILKFDQGSERCEIIFS